jgi:hypothetical protein
MTPWQFFRDGMAGADSVSERLWIIFFTLVKLWLSLGALRMLLPVILIGLAVLAARKPQVRRSRFVQIGFAVLLVGIVPLTLAGVLGADNPIGLALLFAALTPIGLLVVAAGTVLALVKSRA